MVEKNAQEYIPKTLVEVKLKKKTRKIKKAGSKRKTKKTKNKKKKS